MTGQFLDRSFCLTKVNNVKIKLKILSSIYDYFENCVKINEEGFNTEQYIVI